MKNIFLVPVVFITAFINAQDIKTDFQAFVAEDSADIGVLVSYPESTRQNILEASLRPQAIAHLGDLQKQTTLQFKTLNSTYSKEDQKKIWNLTRFDNLIHDLAKVNTPSKRKIESILKNYPSEVHDDAIECSSHHSNLLQQIDKTNKNFDQAVTDILKEYPPRTQNAFRELIKLPEVITILHRNMHLAVTLGDYYKREPTLVTHVLDSLNLELARQKAKDSEEWKEMMTNSPEAANELKQSARDYASEQEYKEEEYRETNPVIIEHYHSYPYPYWCGYPWWYENDYWYPYPYWYHWGFYFWRGDIYWMGPPSWVYLHWHFRHHHHFYDYPHITSIYFTYYYGPRRSASSNVREIHNWIRDNRQKLPDHFLQADEHRVDRIREFGKLELNIEKLKAERPDLSIKRDEFLKAHPGDYPHLQPIPEVRQEIKPKEEIPAAVPKSNEPAEKNILPGQGKSTLPSKGITPAKPAPKKSTKPSIIPKQQKTPAPLPGVTPKQIRETVPGSPQQNKPDRKK